MISFICKDAIQHDAEHIQLTCPKCGRVYSFYYITPEHCYECGIEFPDIVKLKKEIENEIGSDLFILDLESFLEQHHQIVINNKS